jgi:ferric-dicitrate binding protein FerR (iron transport regulator)
MKTPRILLMAAVLAGILVLPVMQGVAQDQPPQQDQPQAPPDQTQTQDQPQAPQDQTVAQPDQAPQPDASPAQDPPGRVARLSYSNGSISFQPGGQGDWVAAVQNRPLSNGDNLWADKDSRAEFQMGSTSVRMDSETSVTFLELDDHNTQLRLSQGSLFFRVRHLDDEDRFEIDTPNSAFQVQRPGEYRVDVNAAGDETDVTVW